MVSFSDNQQCVPAQKYQQLYFFFNKFLALNIKYSYKGKKAYKNMLYINIDASKVV